MPVRVADAVGTKIFRDFTKEQIGPRRVAGAGDTAGRIDNHGRAWHQQIAGDQRQQPKQRRGRIAARIGDNLRAADFIAIQLGQSIRHIEVGNRDLRLTGAKIARQINHLCAGQLRTCHPRR